MKSPDRNLDHRPPGVDGAAVLALELASPMARNALRADQRAPVLYVRSFSEDGADPPPPPGLAQRLRSALFGRGSFEAQLARSLESVGPLVVVGDPGESVPALGAPRLCVAEKRWQPAMTRLLIRSNFLIVHARRTQGVAWALSFAGKMLQPSRVVLHAQFPHANRAADYQSFRELAEKKLPTRLFVELPGDRYITFDADWNPQTHKTIKAVLEHAGR